MSEFVKPVRETVSVKDAFAHLLEQELVKDLHDNEGICPLCKGTGVSIVPNRYGLSDDPDKKFGMFPYQHQSISFCPNCYNGIVRYCPDCGKQLPRTTLQCDCSAAQQRKWAKEQKKLQEAQDTIENAAKKTRTIDRKLKTVSEISDERSEFLLSDGESRDEE